MTLKLAGGHKANAEQNLLTFFLAQFSTIQDQIECTEYPDTTFEMYRVKETNCCFTGCVTKVERWHAVGSL